MFDRTVLAVFIVATLFVGCANPRRKTEATTPFQASPKDSGPAAETSAENAPARRAVTDELSGAPKLYQQAVRDLQDRKFEEALAGFQNFLREHPTSKWSEVATLNSALAFQGLERWSEAITAFRQAIVSSQDVAPTLQITALYGLAGCYEAIGDDAGTIATLRDLIETPRRARLSRVFVDAELPGRLAAAYARVGNVDMAITYYKKAEAGIIHLRAHAVDPKTAPPWLGQTLYLIGQISLQNINWQNYSTVLRALERGQLFLVQAAELGQAPWSEKATENLIHVYNDLWTVLQNPPVPQVSDPLLQLREVQELRWSTVGSLMGELTTLQAYELAGVDATGEPRKIFSYAEDLQKKLQMVLLERPAGEGLTVESIRRRQEIRARTLAPEGALESHYRRGSPAAADPNL